MKVSERTLGVMKNFATINPSLQVKAGNELRTISGSKSVFAQAKVDETFPRQFAIYELSKFLGAVSLFKDPDFEFFDDHVKISEDRNFIRYTYCDESTIVVPPSKDIQLPTKDIYFELSEKDLASLQKAISILQVPEILVTGEDGTTYVKASNSKNPSSDSFAIPVGVTDRTFRAIFKAEYLKLMPGDYQINISNGGFAEFLSGDTRYFIAAEQSSNLRSE